MTRKTIGRKSAFTPNRGLGILPDQIAGIVSDIVNHQKIYDLHTHLYTPRFGTPVANSTSKTDPAGLMLWGVEELVTYHYLVAEAFRVVPPSKLPYEEFWKWPKSRQADHIWKYLFVENTPISEACRGVLTTLSKLGLDPNEKHLDAYRSFFAKQNPSEYIDKVMQLSNVHTITMTNPVFDDNERERWLADKNVGTDPRFKAVLRIDPLLRNFPQSAAKVSDWGYKVHSAPSSQTIDEVKRFLNQWLDRQQAIYMAVSLPPDFRYPANQTDTLALAGQTILEKAILPVCAERKMPFAMMIGSSLRTQPALGDAGDTCGLCDVTSVARLCRDFPNNKFLVTMLARENQHELCVTARKFGNLMPFGCWWFLNNPSLITEITQMRFELLGTSFIPQHSDARVLDQLVYKWDHSRKVITRVLIDMYARIAETGRRLTRKDIEHDVEKLLDGNFRTFLER
ncbi:MAG: glucuronate isomerase [Phycisphaerae bacterium]